MATSASCIAIPLSTKSLRQPTYPWLRVAEYTEGGCGPEVGGTPPTYSGEVNTRRVESPGVKQ